MIRKKRVMRFITLYEVPPVDARRFVAVDQISAMWLDGKYRGHIEAAGKEYITPRDFSRNEHLVHWVLSSPQAKTWTNADYSSFTVDQVTGEYVAETNTLDLNGIEVKFVIDPEEHALNDAVELRIYFDNMRGSKVVPQEEIDDFFEENEKDPSDVAANAFFWRGHIEALVTQLQSTDYKKGNEN